jgi:hypothetical protein
LYRHVRTVPGSFDKLLTTSPVFIRRDVIPRGVKRRIQHFQQPRHQPLTASNHVQTALALMLLDGLFQLLFQVFHTYLHK